MRSRKVLVPLATLAAATAVAVGSGATFTTQTHNTISGVTAGNLKQTNSKADAALFNLSNIKPGDTVTGAVTITNSGSLQQKLTLSEGSIADSFTTGDLKLTVTDLTDSRSVYEGTFAGMGTKSLLADDGTAVWGAGEAHAYRFVVTLASSAGNENQDKHAEAAFTWDGVQTTGTAVDQSSTVPVG
jgi:hypothetical protein